MLSFPTYEGCGQILEEHTHIYVMKVENASSYFPQCLVVSQRLRVAPKCGLTPFYVYFCAFSSSFPFVMEKVLKCQKDYFNQQTGAHRLLVKIIFQHFINIWTNLRNKVQS